MVWSSTPSDNSELNLSVLLSHVSLALFMRLRFVLVVGEFVWSGEQLVDHDIIFSAFPVVINIHQEYCSEFAVTIMPTIYIDLASH